MNAEYQRLEAEAREVQRRIEELVGSAGRMAVSEYHKFESEMVRLHQRLAGLHQGMGLLKLAGSSKRQKQAAAVAKGQSKKFYSQGPRSKTVRLQGGVTVGLQVTYYHRSPCPESAKNNKTNRGMFPMLHLLGIADGFTAGTRQRMMKCAALLGSYEEAVQMLAEEGLKVLFIADGATWIWNRVPGLISALGLKADQVQQRIDFWHAVEYLGKIADSSSLKGRHKTQWRKTQKKRLHRGDIGTVVIEIRKLIGETPTADQTTWLNYFENHGMAHRRMDYSLSRNSHLPIGSGAIESAVRRVINLRVKSNATYWLRENAETIIRFRAWIKAGRAEELFHQTTYVSTELLA